MIGGTSWPLADATASTAAAKRGLKPVLIISGIVKVPVA